MEELLNLSEDHLLLSRLARQVGFWPEFSWIMRFQGLVDSLLLSLSGTKMGISQSPEARLDQILDSTTQAVSSLYLTEVAERNKWSSGHVDSEPMPNFEYPVIVIDNFMSKSTGRHQFVLDALVKWSAELVANKLAHVVYISPNPSSHKFLNRLTDLSLGGTHVIYTKDAPIDSAVGFVRQRLGSPSFETLGADTLERFIRNFGGRSSQLQLFVQKIKAGSSPEDSYAEILEKTILDLKRASDSDNDDGLSVPSNGIMASRPALDTVSVLDRM